MRFAAFDIETTSLNGSYGRLLCAGIKFFDEQDVKIVRAPRLKDERKALEALFNLFDKAHVLVGWNSKHFDARFLQQRAVVLGVRPMPTKMHLDLLHHHRCYFRSAGHSLKRVGEDLGCVVSKYEVPIVRWQEAGEGNKKALDEIVKHCIEDVRLTEEVHWRLAPYIRNITR